MPWASLPSRRRSSRAIWDSTCSASPASPTWRRACCRNRWIMPKCWKRRTASLPISCGCWRESLAVSDPLMTAARNAREQAIAPFSGFKVGAALETTDGLVITGCNIENASYGLTLCAERVAVFKALSEGHRAFRRIAGVADTPAPTAPCGACRQILWEYAGDVEVILANLERETGRFSMKTLLPVPFDAGVLRSEGER